jgi:hypothetical protein
MPAAAAHVRPELLSLLDQFSMKFAFEGIFQSRVKAGTHRKEELRKRALGPPFSSADFVNNAGKEWRIDFAQEERKKEEMYCRIANKYIGEYQDVQIALREFDPELEGELPGVYTDTPAEYLAQGKPDEFADKVRKVRGRVLAMLRVPEESGDRKTTRIETKNVKKTKGKNINAAMKKHLETNPESLGWTIRQWADYLHCSVSTVQNTATWKGIMVARAMREAEMSANSKTGRKTDRRRNGKRMA